MLIRLTVLTKVFIQEKLFLFDISLSGSLMVSIVRFSKQGQLAELFTFMESFPFVI